MTLASRFSTPMKLIRWMRDHDMDRLHRNLRTGEIHVSWAGTDRDLGRVHPKVLKIAMKRKWLRTWTTLKPLRYYHLTTRGWNACRRDPFGRKRS